MYWQYHGSVYLKEQLATRINMTVNKIDFSQLTDGFAYRMHSWKFRTLLAAVDYWLYVFVCQCVSVSLCSHDNGFTFRR